MCGCQTNTNMDFSCSFTALVFSRNIRNCAAPSFTVIWSDVGTDTWQLTVALSFYRLLCHRNRSAEHMINESRQLALNFALPGDNGSSECGLNSKLWLFWMLYFWSHLTCLWQLLGRRWWAGVLPHGASFTSFGLCKIPRIANCAKDEDVEMLSSWNIHGVVKIGF